MKNFTLLVPAVTSSNPGGSSYRQAFISDDAADQWTFPLHKIT